MKHVGKKLSSKPPMDPMMDTRGTDGVDHYGHDGESLTGHHFEVFHHDDVPEPIHDTRGSKKILEGPPEPDEYATGMKPDGPEPVERVKKPPRVPDPMHDKRVSKGIVVGKRARGEAQG